MKVDFIVDKERFEKERIKKNKIFQADLLLPDNMFKRGFDDFLFFESIFLYHEDFFEGMIEFIKKLGNNSFTFYTASPNPESYFYYYFKKYSVAVIPITATSDEYQEFIHRDPGDSPADSMFSNGETVVLFSETPEWGIVASKDWEIGIVGFKTKKVREFFIESFKEDVGPDKMFDTLDSYIQQFDSMFHMTEEAKKRWYNLRKNYLGY